MIQSDRTSPQRIQLGDIASFEMGQSPDSRYVSDTQVGMPFLQGNAEFGAVHPQPRLWCRQPKKTSQVGDCLISVRAPVGALNLADQAYCIGRGLAAVRFHGANPRYGAHLLAYFAPHLRRRAQGTTFEAVGKDDLANLEICHLSDREQNSIADVLDTLNDAIQATVTLVEKLLTAQQGLLLDTFEDKVRSKAVPLGHYLLSIDAGKSPDCPEKPAQAGDWGVLKVSAVVRSGFRPNENKAVLNPVHFNSTYEVYPGDLLITRANTYDLIAQACVVRETPPRLMLCDKTLRLKPNAKASAEFLSIALTTPTARRHIEINATGSSGTMKNITQGAIRAIPVPDLDRPAQDLVTGQMAALAARIQAETDQLNKLKSLKSGLTSDLLTGRVLVPVGASAC